MTSPGIPIREILGGNNTKQTLDGKTLGDKPFGDKTLGDKTLGGTGSSYSKIAERIAELSVPAGLVYIPEETHHKLQYRSEKPYYTYSTISDKLYDTLLDLISVSDKKHTKSTSRKIKIKRSKQTRRND